jgi:paraquat-inducible protein B
MNARTPEPRPEPHATGAPKAQVRRHLGFSWIWLLPLGALGLVAYLVFHLMADRGAMIEITFETAEGLSAGETPVKYKAVSLGTVEDIELADDLSHVVAKVRMHGRAASLLTDHTRFWVVRPRLSGGLSALQSGLETLVSGAYVALDPGKPGGKREKSFKGLEKPPSTRSDEPGSVYFLSSDALGGLGEGAPIHYRDVNAGELLSYELDQKTKKFSLRIFVRAPYDRDVFPTTRFWNGSGLSIGKDADGLHLSLGSIQSLVAGSIAFDAPPDGDERSPSKPGSSFELYPSRAQAEAGFFGPGLACASYFESPVDGLEHGSAVTLYGRRVGSVTSIDVARNARGALAMRIGYVLEPGRATGATERDALSADGLRALVRERMRVVLDTSSFLTGEKELALEYAPGATPASVATEGPTLILPGEAHDIGRLTTTLGSIAAKIDRIPFEAIGEHASHALASIDHVVSGPELARALSDLDQALRQVSELARQAKADMGPALARLPAISEKLERAADNAQAVFGEAGYGSDSTTQRNLERMLDQVADAARSIRLLADFLNRHPEALVSGRRENEP